MNGLLIPNRNIHRYVICLFMALLTMVSVQDTFAQGKFREGHIINLEGDTIPGLISFKRNTLIFKDQALYKAIVYTPAELKGFITEEEQFTSAVLEKNSTSADANQFTGKSSASSKTDTVFLQILVYGEKSLFRLAANNGPAQYIIKNGSRFQTLKTRKYKTSGNGQEKETARQQLKTYLQDCPSMAAVIDETRLRYKSLLRLFDAYYSCVPAKTAYIRSPDRFIPAAIRNE